MRTKDSTTRRWISRAGLLLLLGSAGIWAAPQGSPRNPGYTSTASNLGYVTGEVLIQYRKHVDRASARALSMRSGRAVRALRYSPRNKGPMHLLRLGDRMNVAQALSSLARDPSIEYVQPNYIYRTRSAPNDTSYGQLWGLKNTGQSVSSPVYGTNNPGTAGRDIDAETAWNTITDCSSVVVAVIDSGVNYNHEDLSTNMVSGSYGCPGGTGTYGCDFVGTGDNDPLDVNGHGTHVAAIIGAAGNNSTGVTGVCQKAKILAVRVLDAGGSGTTADIVEGLNFAIGTNSDEGKAKVVNMSLGGPSSDTAFSTAITSALSNDVVVVVAAGNSNQNHNTTNDYPCDYTQANIICVAALDQSYSRASFSDYDTNATAASRHVDIGAPGTNMLSAYYGTDTTISETFTGGNSISWTRAGSLTWGSTYGTCEGGVLNVPSNWCSGGTPGNSLNARVYKNFNLGSYDAATLSFSAWVDLSQSGDGFNVNYKAAGGDPFSSGTSLLSATGALHTGSFVALSYDLSGCTNANCTVGFQFITDLSANSAFDGAGIKGFSITGKSVNNTTYHVENGTSMASPVVAGIATMLRARNPDYTYADVVAAIMNGGDAVAALANNTKSGKAADAFGSLKYIPDVEGVGVASP